MKILAITDIHGRNDVIRKIVGREVGTDVIVLGGDITADGVLHDGWSDIFREYCPVILGVAGNMDSTSVDDTMEQGGHSLNGKGKTLDGVGFFGVSGVPYSPLNAPYEISEEEIMRRAEDGLREVQAAPVKVFVPHAPPFDTPLDKMFLGKHVGSKSVRLFTERFQPDVVICGHIHEARGSTTLGKARVINCGMAGKGYYGVVTIGEAITVENRRVPV